MRLSQPASASSSKGGKHNRLGVRRKKHKKLDAICESAFNQNLRIKNEPNEGNGRAESVGDDSELRRSSRVRRAPVILDVSPPPPKKRRKKFDMNGNRKFGGSGGRGAGDVELGKGGSASTPCSNSKSSEEGSAGWKSRLRSRAGTSSSRAKGKVSSPHGKRKLFKDLDEIEDEVNLVEDGLNDKEEEEGSDGGKSTIVKSKRVGRVRASIDCEAEVQEVADNSGQKGSFEEIVEMSDEEGTLLTRLTSHMNDTHKVEQVDDGASHGVDKECEVASTCLKEKLIVHDDANEEEQVDNSASQVVEKDIGVGSDLEENLIYNEDKNEEEQIDCSASKAVENESEVGNEEHLEDKLIVNDDVEASEQNVNASGPAECVKDGLDEREIAEVFSLPNDLKKDGEHIDGKSSSQTLQQEKLLKDKHVKQTGNSCTTYTPRHRKSRIKEGRRCGLCGGGTDGKPPKRLVPGTGGSDHEPYSGSSDSEEPEYDLLDGFGEEPGWLGRLLGPISDRYGIAGIWVHQQCAVWSPEVYFAGLGCLKNIRAALCRGKALKCTRCGRPGATTGCRVDRCPRTYHLPCARASRCIFDHRKFLIACTDHRHHFQPHGYHYLQRIKKLKAKKMKLEIRKQSNCAWRKDHEAEEKWLEKCGEDEEFLKRETKRLQRDMLRIAPIYVGGSHSEGENLFEGWDSVAGLQDVVRCMKEVVILPLLYPEFFDNMGLTPPRGVLLHGYPGTGKTLVVRSLIGSCARGEKRIAYFARKGADCLGKYVGDAERQLRLLFQVAEKCQPSIIFFDEIDGLAPVRSRQQDQTHSSVVSTLLALMDGLKSRGSVIVIGATNRPDAVDPALRRPGRFDREIYFPLPKVEDRASILALHTRKWPKPLGGSLLQWVAGQTVGFAGADLQALCTQSAMTALKRSCPLQKILLVAGERGFEGKCPQLPSVVVEERDWLEALSKAPPPCSRREAGAAANEIAGAPLHSYLVPCLLEPLSSMIVSLYLDQRIWLPPLLSKAGATIKSVIVSALQKKNLFAKDWWRHVQTMVKESEIAYKIVANFSNLGILLGDATCAINDTSKEVHDDVNARLGPDRHDRSFYGLGNLCYGRKEVGYRMLIAGIPRSGQRHLASCLLHCFVGNTEIHKIDMATISQEGHGDVLQGITQILMRCASLKSCVLFLPRIDLWAVETCYEVREESLSTTENLTSDSDQVDVKWGLPLLPTSDFEGITDTEVVQCASQTWNCFAQQVEALDVSSSLIIMATSDTPYPALPPRVQHFFESGKSTSDGLVSSQQAVPRITIDLDGKVNHEMMMHSFAPELARDLVKQFIQLIYHNVHPHQDPHMLDKGQEENQKDMPLQKVNSSATEEPKTATGPPEDAAQKVAVPRNSRIMKGKSSLLMAITCFGYQILSYPHFSELCWVTSKLKDGPFADVRGPWKGWPFNSCVVRSGNTSEDTGACISSTTKVKEQFSLVRGLLAVGLSAYRGLYTSLSDVSLEVRKVLELLVSEISTRVQAGKDRYQYVRLLSQAAYLEDMVNNWVHSLRSLELDAQTEVTKPKLTDIGSAINNQDCPPDPSQVEANGLNTNLLEAETLHGSVDATTISISEPAALNNEALNIAGIDMKEAINILEAEPVQGVDGTSMNNAETAALNNDARGVVCDDVQELLKTDERIVLPMQLKGSAPLCNNSMVECINREKDASRNAALAVDPVAVTDIQKPDGNQPSRTPSCENNGLLSDTFISNHQYEYTIDGSGLDSLKQFNGFADMKSHVSRDFGCTDHLRSSETYKQPETLSQVENGEADPCIGIDANYSPVRRNHPSAKPEIMCSYSCCFGCANSLHQLIQKVVSKELELTGGCSTVEDVHDFVASLTSSLCLAVRKLHVAGSFAEPDNQVSSESCREVFQSEELDKCKCKMPEIREIIPRECTCHPGKSKSVEVDSSAYHQLTSRFIYKDGVLVPSHPGKDPPFHCKYENFCLCTLLELIVVSRKL